MAGDPDAPYSLLRALRSGRALSRFQVAETLSVSLPTAGGIIRGLLARGLAVEAGSTRTTAGRPPQQVRINPDFAHAVGLWVSSRRIQAQIVDLAGRVVWTGRPEAVCADASEALQRIEAAIRSALSAATAQPVCGIGIGICGVVDRRDGLSRCFPKSDIWKDVPLERHIGQRFSLPTAVHNQVQAATLAELHFGQGRAADALMYLHVGRGIGLGLVSEGRLIRGSRGYAGEIGHMVVDPDGPRCYCGQRGCLEAVAGLDAVARRAAAERDNAQTAIEFEITRAGAITSIEAIFHAAEAGDELACGLLRSAGGQIGASAASVANILNPDMLVLGGMLAEAPAVLIDAISAAFSSHLLAPLVEHTTVGVSQIHRQACGIGAATAVLDMVLAHQDLGELRGQGSGARGQ